MKLTGPNWDARRVYLIRNARIHAHNNGRISHVTGGEVFVESEPITIHAALRVCTDHWTIWNLTTPHPQDGQTSTFGFDVGDDCSDECSTRWFYDVTDIDPVTDEMPTI